MTTTTRAKAKAKASTIDPAVAASQSRLDEALATLDRRERTVAGLAAALASLETQHTAGEDEPTFMDLFKARGELAHAQALAAVASKNVKTARSRLVSTDTSLADLLAAALSNKLGLTVATAYLRPTAAPETLPSLVLIQDKPSVKSTETGALAGEVTAVYTRRPLDRPISAEELADLLNALAAFEVKAATVSVDPVGEAGVDELKITVVRADAPGIPELEVRLDVNVLREPGVRIITDLREQLTYFGRKNSGEVVLLGEQGEIGDKLGFIGGFDAAVVIANESSRGTRTVTIDSPFDLLPAGPFSTPDVLEALRGAVTALVGQVIPSLGRVVSSEVNPHDNEAPARGPRTSTGVVRVVVRSRPLAA